MSNLEIAQLFRKVAAAYTIKNEAKFKFQIIAYQKAADAVDHASIELKTLYKQDKLEKLPGIGPTLEERLGELFTTGKVKHYEELFEDISPAVFPLLEIPSFGPKKANKLVEHFKLKDPKSVIEDIEKKAISGQIREIEGFGEKSEEDILQAIAEFKTGVTKSARMVLPYAATLAQQITEYMEKSKDVIDIKPLGSLRRMVATIGDIDFAVTSKNREAVIKYFTEFPGTERIIEKGDVTASILIGGGKHVDLLVLPPESFGSMLQHFTGSKHHNVRLREYALKKGYSLSEKGIKLKNDGDKLKTFKTEEEFYKFLGMSTPPPEIREDQGEIEAALKNTLPHLVELKDINGDLHIHSNYEIASSHDYGNATFEEMLTRAKELKYEYLGFSEHNPSVSNNTPDKIIEILKRRKEKLDKIQESNKYIRVINLLEVDILANGSLAIPDKAFDYLDAALVSIHSSFATEKDKMTKRVLKGLSHPKAKILSHPTGRLLNSRAGYELNWDEVFEFCSKNNKALEINAWPTRLDLPDTLVRRALQHNIKFTIDTDSHALKHMNNMFYGVSVARRGWCTKNDILNTYSYDKLREWLKS